jgi:small subunit ribosomal protein S9
MASKKKPDSENPKDGESQPTEGAELEAPAEQAPAAEEAPVAESTQPQAPEPPAASEQAPEPVAAEEPAAEVKGEQQAPEPEPVSTGAAPPVSAAAQAPAGAGSSKVDSEQAGEEAPRAKPAVPGAHLEVDIVPEGVDPLSRGGEEYEDPYALEEEYLAPAEAEEQEEREEILSQPIASATIDLAADARYRATGKRKTAIARVTLQPGSGSYVVNGRSLEEHFPRPTLRRNIRQPLEMVGYHERMDVVALLHGGGISAQAGALRHGVSRALLEADPNLRGELKRRGFLTRDSRAKERKKAGLKKARKRPQFSKR